MLARTSLAVLVLTAAATSSARADALPVAEATAVARPDFYVGATSEAGYDLGLRAGVGVEAGLALSSWPGAWLHVRVTSGRFTPFQIGGRYLAAAAGIEGQRCSANLAGCLIGGLDLGVVGLFWDADHDSIVVEGNGGKPYREPTDVALAAIPRIGGEMGTRRVRMRALAQGMAAVVDGELRPGLTLQASLLIGF